MCVCVWGGGGGGVTGREGDREIGRNGGNERARKRERGRKILHTLAHTW